MEAPCDALWFERVLREHHHELWIGDAARFVPPWCASRRRTRAMPLHILDLLLMNRFPRIWVPSPAELDLRQMLRHRHKLVRFRSSVMNQLHALAMGQGLCRRKKLWLACRVARQVLWCVKRPLLRTCHRHLRYQPIRNGSGLWHGTVSSQSRNGFSSVRAWTSGVFSNRWLTVSGRKHVEFTGCLAKTGTRSRNSADLVDGQTLRLRNWLRLGNGILSLMLSLRVANRTCDIV